MTLDYYRIFYYVARYKSFSKAAQILGNNQPNITRYINLLEHELGCSLCVRTHKGISLTPEGQLLYEHVEAAMYQLKNAQDARKKKQSLESGTITIELVTLHSDFISQIDWKIFFLYILM